MHSYEIPWAETAERIAPNEVRFAKCFFPTPSCAHASSYVSCDVDLVMVGHDIGSKGKNILISSETFNYIDSRGIERLKTYLSHWDEVKFVIYYRHYYSWIYSVYNQLSKIKSLRGQNFADFVSHKVSQCRFHAAPLIKKLQASNIQSDDIIAINMHDKSLGGTAESFYCHTMLNITNTCKAIRSTDEISKNEGINIDAIHLAYAAIDAGLYKKKNDKVSLTVLKVINTQMSKLTLKPKRKCMDDNSLNMLWVKSLEYKDVLLSISSSETYHLSLDEENVRLDFEETAKKFCWVNTDDVLSQKLWINFFKSLLDKDPI